METYYYVARVAEHHNESWHRSKDHKGGESPYGNFMMNKKWTLLEEFNVHILRFQQVTLSSI